ncbi:MAG: hypothetical protein KJO65_07985 [Gemmatimonadetes bacterium]|nr:hypothetical protein [Gemmatimonadota bacterium]
MDSIPLIDVGLTGLHDARPAGVFPFLAEGESSWVRGVASRPELDVGRGGRPLVTIRPETMGMAANVLLFPGMARREFASAGGQVVETALALPTLPLAVVQWKGSREALPPSIVVLLHEVAAGPRVTDEGSVILEGGRDSGTPPMEIRLVPPAAEVRLDVVEGVVQVVFRPTASAHASLILAVGDKDGRRTSMAAAKHARSHAIRAAAGPAEGLEIRTGVADIDDAVAWLRVRLFGQARRITVGVDEGAALSIGLAATAVGDRDSSLAVLGSMAQDSVERALLAARHAAVFGETSRAREYASRWATRAPPPSSLVALTAVELADALHLAGDAASVSRLRALGEADTDPPSPSRHDGTAGGRPLPSAGRSLPMARRSQPDVDGLATTLLRRLLAGDPSADAVSPDAAWMAWRDRLVDGSGRIVTLWDEGHPRAAGGSPEQGPGGRSPSGSGGSATAGLLLDLTSGILGVRADAAAGRIRIAPRLPNHLTRFEASGIRVGSSTIKLRFSATPEILRYELVPESAAVPPLVIFEPSMSGRPREVRVDGGVAELDARASGSRTVVPVQLPLDALRVVEIARSRV